MPKEPTQVIYVRLPRRIVKKLKDLAYFERRTMAAQIELALDEWVDAKEVENAPQS